jgi:hypothetical protein
MVQLDAEVKQITHAIRMAACNAETALARALDGLYARVGDEAYPLIREALVDSGDIIPGHGELLIRLDPPTAPRRTHALAALCDQLTQARARYPGTGLVLRYDVKRRHCVIFLPMSVLGLAEAGCVFVRRGRHAGSLRAAAGTATGDDDDATSDTTIRPPALTAPSPVMRWFTAAAPPQPR